MEIRFGTCCARCPYCGAAEFVDDDERTLSQELTCASCGGLASRQLLLEIAREEGARQAGGKE